MCLLFVLQKPFFCQPSVVCFKVLLLCYLLSYLSDSGTNVALRRPANQSTTVRGGSAGNANDGEMSTVHDGRHCSETLKEASPWWQVDLLRPYPVAAVRVTTRSCCGVL